MKRSGHSVQGLVAACCVPAVLTWALATPLPASSQEQTAAPASSRLPLRTAGPEDSPMAALGPMIAVLGLGALGLWVWLALRGRGGAAGLRLGRWLPSGQDGGRLQVLDRTALIPGCTLCVVRWGEHDILLACSDKAVTLISQRPASASTPGGPTGESP